MAYALKTACARNITGVIPYFPYSKQSKMRKRGSIVCKLLASMLAKAGECRHGLVGVNFVIVLLEISPCLRADLGLILSVAHKLLSSCSLLIVLVRAM